MGAEVAMERNQAEEITRAADRITEAVRELTYAVNKLAEYEQLWLYWPPGRRPPFKGLSEEDATALSLAAVHRAREEIERKVDAPAPSQDEIERWNQEQDYRRREEGF
jgi:hypothetical protein